MILRIAVPASLICLLFLSLSSPEARELYARPNLPDREVLESLNLKLAWKINVPMDGKRDDFESIRFLDDQILVQTKSGGVFLYDSADGTNLWRRSLEPQFHVSCPPGFNKFYVFAVRGTKLIALERKTGSTVWKYDLPNVPIVAPVADERRFYFILGRDTLQAYWLPSEIEVLSRTESRYRVNPLTGVNEKVNMTERLGPREFFSVRVGNSVGQAPLYVGDVIAVPGENGTIALMSPDTGEKLREHTSKGELASPLNYHGDSIYLGTSNFTIACFDVKTAKVAWRQRVGGAVFKRPETTEEDLYVLADQVGLARYDRKRGKEIWVQRDAVHYLASNKRFVYAINGRGEMVVLDRERGTSLGKCNVSKFTYLVSNDRTDRVFLAGPDGMLVCLRDKDYAKPMIHKRDPDYAEFVPATNRKLTQP